ncbi:MAG: hypothetical protein EOS43_31115 [Mesorhizobium sp.]|nr:MAG: hypothetical protein EOS43_31115 [Mesorhizobium sp.]
MHPYRRDLAPSSCFRAIYQALFVQGRGVLRRELTAFLQSPAWLSTHRHPRKNAILLHGPSFLCWGSARHSRATPFALQLERLRAAAQTTVITSSRYGKFYASPNPVRNAVRLSPSSSQR